MKYICPTCGCEATVGKPCPGCPPPRRTAPRKRKSWEQESSADGLGLPDDDFDYEDFISREFGKKPHRRARIPLVWWLTALVLLVVFSAYAIHLLR